MRTCATPAGRQGHERYVEDTLDASFCGNGQQNYELCSRTSAPQVPILQRGAGGVDQCDSRSSPAMHLDGNSPTQSKSSRLAQDRCAPGKLRSPEYTLRNF